MKTSFWAFALCLLPFNGHSSTVTLNAIDSGAYAFRAGPDGGFERNLGADYEITLDPGIPQTQPTNSEISWFLT